MLWQTELTRTRTTMSGNTSIEYRRIIRSEYLHAKRDMRANPTLNNILVFVDIASQYMGRLTAYHYDLANKYLKRCK